MKLRNFLLALLLILFIVLLLIIFHFAKKNFTGLGPTPIRSAFAGRLPNIQDHPHLFRFYYSTIRENSPETFDGRGDLLGDEISQGTYDVFISPYLAVKPFVWFDQESLEWRGREAMPRKVFWQKIQQDIQLSPKKSLLIIVWGFRDWFTSAALKTAYQAYVLDINTPVLLFDWPGNQGEGRQGYRASQNMTTPSAAHLGRLLVDVLQKTDAEEVWLLGSSLGCQTIAEAFKWLEVQSFKPEKQKISHVVFSAPDVPADAFDETFAQSIQKLSHHLTAYVSSNDRALLMSHWINRRRRLGRKAHVLLPPDERNVGDEFEEAFELLTLKEKGVRMIEVVDATPINTERNLHHFFTDSPIFFDDLYQRLLRPDDIVNRRLHHVRLSPNGTNYGILWND